MKEIRKQDAVIVGTTELVPTTLKQFLEIYKIDKVEEELSKVISVRDAIMAKTPSIAKIKSKYGEKKIAAYIKVWVLRFNSMLNVTRPLKPYQIDRLATKIVRKFWALRIADIYMVFNRAEEGYYGASFESISIDKIQSWFSEYYEERLVVGAGMSLEEHDRIKYMQEKTKGTRRGLKEMEQAVREYKIQEIQNEYKSKKQQGNGK